VEGWKVKGQKEEDGSWKTEDGSWKREDGSWKRGVGSGKTEVGRRGEPFFSSRERFLWWHKKFNV